MKIKFQLLTVLLLLLPFCRISAQSKSIDDILEIALEKSGPILKGNIVTGYYLFYNVDQLKDKKNLYLLRILDANLNEVGSYKMTESKFVELKDVAYDGKYIMMKFYNFNETKLMYYKYDEKAVLQSRDTIIRKTLADPSIPNNPTGEKAKIDLIDLPGTGFLDYSVLKIGKQGYEIRFVPDDDKKNKEWIFQSDPNSKELQYASFLAANNTFALTALTKQSSIFNPKFTYYLSGTDLKNGKQLFEFEFSDPDNQMVPLNAYADTASENIVVFGLYYDNNDDVRKDNSKGLFAIQLNKKGDYISKKFISWKTDISKLAPLNKRERILKKDYILFHHFFKMADGKVYAIGELCQKSLDVIFGGAKAVVKDLVVFEFAPDFTLEKTRFFEKKPKEVFLTSQAGLIQSEKAIADIIRSSDGFAYSFTQTNPEKTIFSIGYLENQGEKNETFKALTRVDNDYTTDKIDLKTKGSTIRVLPAKPGYIMIMEYFKKEKKLDMRLEKINY